MQNSLYLFHTRSTAEGFLYIRELSAAVEGGLEGKDWRCLHTESHLRIATRLLYLFHHLSFIHLSLTLSLSLPLPLSYLFYLRLIFPLSLPLIFFYFISIWHPMSTDYCNRYECVMCNFPLFHIIENLRSATLCTSTNVSASQPLSSSCRDTKCQPLSSVTAFVNYSHLEMSMSKPQWEGADSWKAESTAHSNPQERYTGDSWSPNTEKLIHTAATNLLHISAAIQGKSHIDIW